VPTAPAGSERFSRGGQTSGDAQIESLRLPPHSVEAEQAVLGGLLLSNPSFDRIGDIIAGSDFYRADHRLLWGAITRLIEDNKPADVLTVSEALKVSGELQDVGGLSYLHQLATGTPSAANIRRYAEIVRERAIMRKLAEVGTMIADSAYSPQGREARQLLDEAETRILEIGESGGRSNESFQTMSAMLAEVMSRLDELHKNPNAVTGVATGFVDLDEMTTGLQAGDLVIVAGRPAMGKAQPLDAKIKTPSGWKAMGTLQVGDAIASIDGDPSIVVGVYPQGVRQVYRLAFSDGRSTEACAEHLWRVYCTDWEGTRILETQALVALLPSYPGALWMDSVSGHFGHHDALPVDPWFLGTVLAEDKHFDRPSADAWPPMLEEFVADGSQALATRIATPQTLSPAVQSALALTQGGQFIPLAYRNARREARMALLQGLLDNRATVEKSGAIQFTTASYGLATDVQELVRSVGGSCKLTPRSASCLLEIHHPAPRSLFRLEQKRKSLPATSEMLARPVLASIVPTRTSATQCIAVSHPTHLYISDDYVVTHNTSFALNVAEHVSLELKLPVLVFSMEMGGTQLATRMLGSVGKVDAQKLRTGRLDPGDWDRLGTALGKLNEAPLLIDESPGLNPLELRSRARRKWREYGGLGLIVIDYIQLMQGSESTQENRATELSEISRSMKHMAKELKVPVIALSQLNRGLEQRPNKRPVMSDLRESGALEQDADMIVFIYRDEVYNEESPDKGIAEIIVGKQRNGPIGTVKLTFLGKHTRFENYSGASGY
jgi:replicative DNA helicase